MEKLNIVELQNVRRIFESGLNKALNDKNNASAFNANSYIDIFQHGLDLLESSGLPFPKDIFSVGHQVCVGKTSEGMS